MSSKVTFGSRFASGGKAAAMPSSTTASGSFVAVDAPSSLDHLHLAQGAAKSLKARAEKRLASMIPATVSRVTTSEVTAGALMRSRRQRVAKAARESSSYLSPARLTVAAMAKATLPSPNKAGVMYVVPAWRSLT